MRGTYKDVLCDLGTYRLMGEAKPALYYVDSPDQETMLNAGFQEVHYGLWVKVLEDEEYQEIADIFMGNSK